MVKLFSGDAPGCDLPAYRNREASVTLRRILLTTLLCDDNYGADAGNHADDRQPRREDDERVHGRYDSTNSGR